MKIEDKFDVGKKAFEVKDKGEVDHIVLGRVGMMMYANLKSASDREKFRKIYPKETHIYDGLKEWVEGEREKFVQLSSEEQKKYLYDYLPNRRVPVSVYFEKAAEYTHLKMKAEAEGRTPENYPARV